MNGRLADAETAYSGKKVLTRCLLSAKLHGLGASHFASAWRGGFFPIGMKGNLNFFDIRPL